MKNFPAAKKKYSLMSRKFTNHDDCKKNSCYTCNTYIAYLYNHLHLITLTLNRQLYYYNSDVAIFQTYYIIYSISGSKTGYH